MKTSSMIAVVRRFERNGLPPLVSSFATRALLGRNDGFSAAVASAIEARQAFETLDVRSRNAFRIDKLRTLLRHAADHTQFYRERFESSGFDLSKLESLSDLKRIPVLDKVTLQAHRESMVSDIAKREELNLNSTGGSTGAAVNFYQDKNWLIAQVAGAQHYDGLAGWQTGVRTAYLWGAPTDNEKANTNSWKSKLKSVLSNTRLFDSFNMSDEQMAEYHEQLTVFQPDVIVAYAGSIHQFSQYLKRSGAQPNYPRLSIITSAETLTTEMRSDIESTFRKKVFNRYGSREVGLISAECSEHDGMHVNEFDLIVEEEDDSGELLITNLNNFGMPLIRYRIGDIGKLGGEPCSCGRHGGLITKLLGRSSDFFLTSSGRRIHGEYFSHLFYGCDEVRRFQFVQHELDDFELKIVRAQESWSDITDRYIRREVWKVFGDSATLRIVFVDEIPVTASGKHRFTISKVTRPT